MKINLNIIKKFIYEVKKHPYCLLFLIFVPILMLQYKLRYDHWFELKNIDENC